MSDTDDRTIDDQTIKAIHSRLRSEFGEPDPGQEPTRNRIADQSHTSIKAVHAHLLGGEADPDQPRTGPRDGPPESGSSSDETSAGTSARLPVPQFKQALVKWESLGRNSQTHQVRDAGSPSDGGPNVSLFRTGVAGAIVVAITFAGFGGWAATAPLASAVVAEGVLKIASERKAIQHVDGGVVRGILVRDGDVVRKGDALIRLDDVTVRATLDSLRIRYDAARARKARLESEKLDLAEINFPTDLDEQRSANPDIRDLMDNELAIFG